MIEGRDEILGEHLGMVNKSSIGRTAAHGTRSPSPERDEGKPQH
jgi:hypothetical protein